MDGWDPFSAIILVNKTLKSVSLMGAVVTLKQQGCTSFFLGIGEQDKSLRNVHVS